MFHEIHCYLLAATPERPPVMKEMERYATRHSFPIIGPLVGRFLYQMALTAKAERVLELGSGFGYSAYWFSLAMGKRGHITLTEGDSQNLRRAHEYFRRARLKSTFDFLVGDALTVARPLRAPIDIILNDINKDEYPDTIEFAARRLRKGGLFITDNVIWSGRVLNPKRDATTKAIVTFTRRLYHDRRFFTTILPLRDGLSVSVRL